MLDISSLQYNSEYPGFTSILITVISSMVLGVLLAFTYDKTSREVNRPNHFIQAMILVTIVAATVIQAIGDSVARGLGMIGALSIIRFRTTVRNPRNIVFMFGSIAVGIATGVFGFLIAIVGTVGFCTTAFLLYYSSFSPKEDFIWKLKIEFDTAVGDLTKVDQVLNMYCQKFQLKKKQTNIEKGFNNIICNYDLKLKKNYSEQVFLEALSNISGLEINKFGMEKNTLIDI